MKRFASGFFFTCLILMMVMLTGCAGQSGSKKIVGTWVIQSETYRGETKTITTGDRVMLGDDGTVYDADDYLRVEVLCIHDGINSWKVITDGTLLFYDTYGDQYGVSYEISGSTLKLITSDNMYYTFKK